MKTLTFHLREGEEFIPLIQLLKAVNVVYSGSDAQECVARGMVGATGKPKPANEPKSAKAKSSSSTATGSLSKPTTRKNGDKKLL